jgi:hypothetical protein
MHLSAPFIKRPVATTLLSLALLLAGSVAYSLLPVASLPEVDLPTISASMRTCPAPALRRWPRRWRRRWSGSLGGSPA